MAAAVLDEDTRLAVVLCNVAKSFDTSSPARDVIAHPIHLGQGAALQTGIE